MQLRYPACLLEEALIHSCLTPQPVHLLGSSSDVVAAALAAGSVAGMLNHRREAAEMAAAGLPESNSGSALDSSSSGGSEGCPSRRTSYSSSTSSCSASSSGRPRAVCLVVAPPVAEAGSASSPAAAAALRALERQVPGLQASTVVSSRMLDEEWMALWQADVVILDMQPGQQPAPVQQGEQQPQQQQPPPPQEGDEEQQTVEAQRHMTDAGLQELVVQRFWGGCLVVGVGRACALLGRQSCGTDRPPAVLPWYLVRAGGGAAGWASLHAALTAARQAPAVAGDSAAAQPPVGVGVLAGGCWVAAPLNGKAELLAAPCRDSLVAMAAWSAVPGHQPAAVGLEEADDADWGFFCELCCSNKTAARNTRQGRCSPAHACKVMD